MRPLLAAIAALSLAACHKDDSDTHLTPITDEDGDGWDRDNGDCDDEDADVHPEADELCNGVDDDCDGTIDEDPVGGATWYADADGDGWGDEGSSQVACDPGEGWVERAGDCDDTREGVNPDADERCNDRDDDCDGETDEPDAVDAQEWYLDDDGDLFGDEDAGVVACDPPEGYVRDDRDCDDGDADVNPDADEICNGVDDDCDGRTDPADAIGASTWYADTDLDGHGDPDAPESACEQPAGHVASMDDCDDDEPAAFPGNTEICDGIDNDCDGTVDGSGAVGATTWYRDVDGDSYGDASRGTVLDCTAPTGYAANDDDCEDDDANVNPGEAEICNGIDDDCDGLTDDSSATDAETWYRDLDGDTYGSAASGTLISCTGVYGYSGDAGDCNDADAAINPDADEECDGVDNNCDGSIDGADAVDLLTWYADTDGDDYGDPTSTRRSCVRPSGHVGDGTDCDDDDDTIYPGAEEVCDGVDQDCNGDVDDAATDAQYLSIDADGDGWGVPGTTDLRCEGADNELDCDDEDDTEPHMVDVLSMTTTPAGTRSDPWLTIQDGIDAATSCVVVAPGTYTEAIDFGGKGVKVSSMAGPGATIIDADLLGPVVTFDDGEDADAELSGFTLTGGMGHQTISTTSYTCGSGSTCRDIYTSWCGGGVYVDGATPVLRDLLVQGNAIIVPADVSSTPDSYYYFSYGGGMCFRNTTIEVEQVDVSFNLADNGAGVYVESTADLTFREGAVVANNAESGGAFQVDGGALELMNVLSAFNYASVEGGGVLAIDAAFVATNVTLGEDDAPTGAGLYADGTTSAIVRNSVVYGADTGVGVLVDSTASFTGTYNDVYGNTGGNYSGTANPTGTNGNLSVDPLFVTVTDDGDFSNDDFHLQSTSPCVNAGNPATAQQDADGTTNDQGAWGGPRSTWN